MCSLRRPAAKRLALNLRATRSPAQDRRTKSVPRQGHNTPLPLKRSPPVSFKRMLDGALFTDARARRSEPAPALDWEVVVGNHPLRGRARRGLPIARPWGVGRGEQISAREHRRSAPRVFTEQNELTKGCLWGGSAPPNGSRLSCGRLARRAQGR